MISFLRRIRRNLAYENRPAKYLRYAFGEIILVVIGILLALQVNSWNEYKKNRRIELTYEKELLKDFQDNYGQTEFVMEQYEQTLPMLIELLRQSSLENHTVPVDTLNWYYGLLEFIPTFSSTDRVYNTILGSGDLKLIKNTELKSLLSEYYESLHMLNMVQNTHELQLVNSIQPYTIKNLDFQAILYDPESDFPLPIPVDNDKILTVLKDTEFRNIVTLKWQISMDIYSQVQYIEEIVLDIIKELETSIELKEA